MAAAQAARRQALQAAFALALGSAVSLGLARFSYALLLPPMRADLQWSYALSGLMNAVNALGYLVGALSLPVLTARLGARRLLILGSALAAVVLALHGAVRSNEALLFMRFASGVASGFVFATGGLLAARLSNDVASQGVSAGLLLGIYYGGTGWGIVLCALMIPAFEGWPAAWIALGVAAALATAAMAWAVPPSQAEPPRRGAGQGADVLRLARGIAGYFLFGVGYIGYMTFIVTLLREQALGTGVIVAFYALLGAGVIASPWLWAGLLQRERGGGALARLNALLAVSVILPVVWTHPAVAFVSGAIFGSVFLSVVASTTAMVRHNLAPERWTAGIAAFTVIFAFGQILGPALVGWVSDQMGGLRPGLALSAAALLLGAVVAWGQRGVDQSKVE